MSTINGKSYQSPSNLNIKGGARGTGLIRFAPPVFGVPALWSTNPFSTDDYGLYVNSLGQLSFSSLGFASVIATAVQRAGSSAAINSTATATAAQVATGYITSTSGAATTITMPTGTLLGAALGATAGTVFNLVVNNTAGANTVTMAVAVNGILSAMGGTLTLVAGVTGMAGFTLMFSSATAYTITRTA